MKTDFDFSKIGKKMPYTVPDNFFDQIEDTILEKVKNHQPIFFKPKKNFRLITFKVTLAIAATIALFFIVKGVFFEQRTTISDVEQAFSKLSEEDQNYIITVFEDDVFINE
ncbi:hypothetical protein HMPREF1977_0633 [Capnocytophaga ochracea F0287]|uniref:Uncharacterized protein n=1 Tax=Capnocytophaga ochracea F0287 TaxID=873517 RepID=E4MQH3_CAPOC|nr:hypothetical protein [Capnocytophaga ochracea]EFS98084.1 hypothetical protein HMPREF1977_0633 [Capnocytophaga ochracea F0287]EJF45446.1 hypothetical protein HMPREF1319_0246 [Capnocytophaga ochracea str. Holt 25]UEB43651.1 hypothetical protein LK419_01355 [Capnocytophaga ochracea]